jgi:hypothetical protein
VNPFLLLSISQRDYEIKLGLRISAVGESLQFYFSAKQEHSSRLKQRADFLRILLKNRLEGKRGEIGPNSELVGVINRRWLNELFPRTSGIIIDRRTTARFCFRLELDRPAGCCRSAVRTRVHAYTGHRRGPETM